MRYVAIFKSSTGEEYVIEYKPCYDECAGAIEILSVEHTRHPQNWQEHRAKYQGTPTPRKPRQIDLFTGATETPGAGIYPGPRDPAPG